MLRCLRCNERFDAEGVDDGARVLHWSCAIVRASLLGLKPPVRETRRAGCDTDGHPVVFVTLTDDDNGQEDDMAPGGLDTRSDVLADSDEGRSRAARAKLLRAANLKLAAADWAESKGDIGRAAKLRAEAERIRKGA